MLQVELLGSLEGGLSCLLFLRLSLDFEDSFAANRERLVIEFWVFDHELAAEENRLERMKQASFQSSLD